MSKLTGSDGDNSETDSSLDFARDCKYIKIQQHAKLVEVSREIGKMLGKYVKKSNSLPYCRPLP